jgi:RNA polymerase sigma-70 factor (ECF subfamily)
VTAQTPAERLSGALQGALAAARAAWPDLALDGEAFIGELKRRIEGKSDALAALEKLHAADLYIACAVARRVPGALAELERRFFPDTERTIAAADPTGALKDDAQQILRERLFLGDGGGSIAQYAGKGPLSAWLRVSALRVLSRLRESKQRETDVDRLDQLADRALLPAVSDPELELLKATYRREFRQAFHDALAALEPRERNVLRLHTIDGVTGDQIAELYGVSRASSSRWLSRARETLFSRTRELLAERLGLAPSQLDSVTGLVLSQLDLSLRRVL